MSWINTSATCTSVYGALGDLKQIDDETTFEAAGPLAMKDLAFFNALASGDINNASALALAETLDSELAGTYNGAYAAGINSEKAVNSLATIPEAEKKTVEYLADTASSLYGF